MTLRLVNGDLTVAITAIGKVVLDAGSTMQTKYTAAELKAALKEAGMVMVPVERMVKLEAVAHAAWHALDDSGDSDGSNDVQIMRLDFDQLCDALDALGGGDGGDIHQHLPYFMATRTGTAERHD